MYCPSSIGSCIRRNWMSLGTQSSACLPSTPSISSICVLVKCGSITANRSSSTCLLAMHTCLFNCSVFIISLAPIDCLRACSFSSVISSSLASRRESSSILKQCFSTSRVDFLMRLQFISSLRYIWLIFSASTKTTSFVKICARTFLDLLSTSFPSSMIQLSTSSSMVNCLDLIFVADLFPFGSWHCRQGRGKCSEYSYPTK